MDSALSPREIQARIRAGETLEVVAEAAGVPAEQIEPFAAPVIAEREHVLRQALGFPVRRTGESSSVRPLREVVRDRLQHQHVDPDEIVWDAWRDPDRRWILVATYAVGDDVREARFGFDLRGRFSTARDDQARRLIGEPIPDAVQPADPDSEPTVDLDSDPSGRGPRSPDFPARPVPRQPMEQVQIDDEPELTLEASQDDLVGHASQLDVFYDMLSSFDEDSVNVYADLSLPVTDDDPDDERLAEAFDNEDLAPAEDAAPLEDGTATSVDKPVADEATDEESATEDVTSGEYPAPVTARPRQRKQSAVKPPTPEPEQDRLVDVSEPAPPRSRAKSRKTRASIPTWDEIVFGGPKPKESPEQPGH